MGGAVGGRERRVLGRRVVKDGNGEFNDTMDGREYEVLGRR